MSRCIRRRSGGGSSGSSGSSGLTSVLIAVTAAFSLLLALQQPPSAYAQQTHGFGDSPFERDFGDVKFLDAYFGLEGQKMEAGSGDRNVPLTVVLANVGTQDITGIRGQLSLDNNFSPSDGPGSVAYADADSNSLAGTHFTLTFFVNVDDAAQPRQYPGTVKVDYARLRESGTRTVFFNLDFKLTGDSIINMHAVDPFLTSLRENKAVVEISNDGTAPVSDVEIELQNTQTAISSTSTSITNVEKVVILDSNWEVGHMAPGESRIIEFSVYVPESLRGESLRTPMSVSYFNAHGDVRTINRVVDFFVRGLIDLDIYDVKARTVGERQLITGEIINEGNEDALFAFVTMSPAGGSNLEETRQFIDEVETDAPVPFNIPVKFDGQPRYGEHDIKITVRYKDSLRDEHFEVHEATVVVDNPVPDKAANDAGGPEMILVLAAIAAAIVAATAAVRRRRKGRQKAAA